jgi:hypothetical protein
MGPNDVYTIFKLEGRDSRRLCTLRPDSVRTACSSALDALHSSRDNVDASVREGAQQLGGKVIIAPAFDVYGRRTYVSHPGSDRRAFLPMAAE